MVLAVALAAMSACQSAAESDGSEASPPAVVGTEWKVVSIGGVRIDEEPAVTLILGADGRIIGSAGCNRFQGGYTLDGDFLSLGEVALTKRACLPRDVMDVERRFMAMLSAATRVEVEGEALLIHCAGAEEPLRLVANEDTVADSSR